MIHMTETEYVVIIADDDVAPSTGVQATEITRVKAWRLPAESKQAAIDDAWTRWDDEYGPGNQPTNPIVIVQDVVPGAAPT